MVSRRGLALFDAGLDTMDAVPADPWISEQLAFAFVARRSDHGVRGTDCTRFLRDPFSQFAAAAAHRPGLVEPERMGGVDEGNAESITQREGDIGGIGEMGMDAVGQALAAFEFPDQRGGEGGAVLLQRLFRQIAAVTAVDAGQGQVGRDLLARHGVYRTKLRGVEQPRDDLGAGHVGAPRQRLHLAQHVGNMAAGILGDAVTDGRCLDAPAKRQGNDMHRADCLYQLLRNSVGTRVARRGFPRFRFFKPDERKW